MMLQKDLQDRSSHLLDALNTKRKTIRKSLIQYSDEGRQYPWRNPRRTPYEILIAEVILKRTTATAASRVYLDILDRFPSAGELNKALPEDIAKALTVIGLQHQRARSLKKLAQHLIEKEGGRVPKTLEDLLKVPGIGDYAARAILSFAYGLAAAVVDSNVQRILERVFHKSLLRKTSLGLFQEICDELLPRKNHRKFNFAMLDLGALVCRPVRPVCHNCPLQAVCDYHEEVLSSQTRAEYLGLSESALRRTRKSKGMSLVELSKRAKISKLTIIRIENGKSTPTRETVKKLSTALQVSTKELLAS